MDFVVKTIILLAAAELLKLAVVHQYFSGLSGFAQ